MKTMFARLFAVAALLPFFCDGGSAAADGADVPPPAALPEKGEKGAEADKQVEVARRDVWREMMRSGEPWRLEKVKAGGGVRYRLAQGKTSLDYGRVDDLVRDVVKYGKFSGDFLRSNGEASQSGRVAPGVVPWTREEEEKLALGAGSRVPEWSLEDRDRYYVVRLADGKGKVSYRGSVDIPSAGMWEKKISWDGWDAFDDFAALEARLRRWNGVMIPVVVEPGYFRHVPPDAEVSYCSDEEWKALRGISLLPVDILIEPIVADQQHGLLCEELRFMDDAQLEELEKYLDKMELSVRSRMRKLEAKMDALGL